MAEWKKTPDFRSGRVKKVNFLNEQREREREREREGEQTRA